MARLTAAALVVCNGTEPNRTVVCCSSETKSCGSKSACGGNPAVVGQRVKTPFGYGFIDAKQPKTGQCCTALHGVGWGARLLCEQFGSRL
jgi:hypothetical protein